MSKYKFFEIIVKKHKPEMDYANFREDVITIGIKWEKEVIGNHSRRRCLASGGKIRRIYSLVPTKNEGTEIHVTDVCDDGKTLSKIENPSMGSYITVPKSLVGELQKKLLDIV